MAFDVMQDVFTRLVSGQDEFRGESSPLTFLYQVATHRCLNLIRDALTKGRLLALEPRGEAGPTTPEQSVAVAELLRAVPEDLREIAVYYFVDQMDQQEIATLTGVSRRTIGNRLDAFKTLARAAGAER